MSLPPRRPLHQRRRRMPTCCSQRMCHSQNTRRSQITRRSSQHTHRSSQHTRRSSQRMPHRQRMRRSPPMHRSQHMRRSSPRIPHSQHMRRSSMHRTSQTISMRRSQSRRRRRLRLRHRQLAPSYRETLAHSASVRAASPFCPRALDVCRTHAHVLTHVSFAFSAQARIKAGGCASSSSRVRHPTIPFGSNGSIRATARPRCYSGPVASPEGELGPASQKLAVSGYWEGCRGTRVLPMPCLTCCSRAAWPRCLARRVVRVLASLVR